MINATVENEKGSYGMGLENRGDPLETVVNLLVSQVSDLLGRPEDSIDIAVSLLDQGFESLMIVDLQNRIESRLDITTSVEELIGCESIERIAEYLVELYQSRIETRPYRKTFQDKHKTSESSYEIRELDLFSPFELTDVQQAYWIGKFDGIDMGNVATHLYYEFESENIDIDRLSASLNRLIDRHPMLRCIINADGMQQILEHVPLYSIETMSLTDINKDEVEEILKQIRNDLSTQVIDSSKWPLFAVKAARTPSTTRVMIYIDNLIMDGASLVIFFKELRACYIDPFHDLPALNYTFKDHVISEPIRMEDPSYIDDLSYWQERIPELPQGPDLALAKDLSAVKGGHKTVRIEGMLPKEAWDTIKIKAKALKLSPSGVLLTAYAFVLNMWSKEPRFSINMTVFNRPSKHPQINDIIGDFTNLTLVSFDGSSSVPFQEQAQTIQKQIWRNLDHIQVGFLKIQREYRKYHANHSGILFPVVFTSLINPHQEALSQELLWLGEEVYSISQTPQVLIDHIVQEKGGDLHVYWDYVEEMFPESYIPAMFNAFTKFLKALVDQDAWRMVDAGCFFPVSQMEVRNEVNRTDAPISHERLNTLFEKMVLIQPNSPAIISNWVELSYLQLDMLSNVLAWNLLENGASTNQLIAVIMEKGWEQVVAVLAILKAGAAYLPIEAGLPEKRIRFILNNARVSQIVTQPCLASQFSHLKKTLHSVALDQRSNKKFFTRPNPQNRPEDLAYVIYTSGSTGNPKGVMIDHRGAVNTIIDINTRFNILSGDRILGISSLSFDLSVFDIFGTLAAGATLVLPDSNSERDPKHWFDLIEKHAITVWNSAPALMELLTDYSLERDLSLHDRFRLVMMSGDWIPVSLPDKIRSISNNPRIISLGGATEASIWSILYPIHTVNKEWKSIPYGKPMINQRFHVLNSHLSSCPDWVPGDLYISGIGLAKGYWENKEKTDASFFHHPVTNERLYKTGDLGRYLPDGTIEFLGREDFQIKISGYRIELEEIETVLLQHEEIQGAIVNAWGGPKKKTGLAAYIISKKTVKNISEFIKTIRSYLKQKLPGYMVPGKIIMVDHFPLSPNGKVDRSALQKIQPDLPEEQNAATNPEGALEEVLAGIVGDMLHLEYLGMEDDLFLAGMDSLQAVRLNGKIHDVFQISIPLGAILELNTLKKIASYLLEEEGVPGSLCSFAELYQKVSNMSYEELAFELENMNEMGTLS